VSSKGHPAADGDDLLPLDRQLCFQLYAATNLLQRLYRPLLAPLGLTYSQYLVMLVLWEREETSVCELRECLHLDVGTLSPLLKRMERAGFLTRQRDADDERRVLVALTARGRSLRRQAKSIPAALAKLTGLKPDEVVGLRDQTRALVARLITVVPAAAGSALHSGVA
jgi:DNA-binding MarR family transcriptional regulator